MSHLIVRARRQDFEKKEDFRDGAAWQWFLNRSERPRVSVGDVVYFWGSDGDFEAIYGWSIITEIKDTDTPHDDPRVGAKDFEIDFEHVNAWPKPALKSDLLRMSEAFGQMAFMRATDSPLLVMTPDEARALNIFIRQGLDRQSPEDPPGESSERPRQAPPVSDLVGTILRRGATDGVVSADHVVRNFGFVGGDTQPMTAPWFLRKQLERVWEVIGMPPSAPEPAPPTVATLRLGKRPVRVTQAVARLIDDAAVIARTVSSVETVAARHLLGAILNSDDPEVLTALRRWSDAGVEPTVVRTAFRVSLVENGYPKEREAWRQVLKSRSEAQLVSEFSGDDPLSGTDCLGFEADYQAMATLITSRDLDPPLAIGIFGNWGSGKSFFMHKLEKQVEHLTDLARKDSPDKPRFAPVYWRRIKQIKFNAWHYVDSNLWASLVAHVFDELAKPLEEKVLIPRSRSGKSASRNPTSRSTRLPRQTWRSRARPTRSPLRTGASFG